LSRKNRWFHVIFSNDNSLRGDFDGEVLVVGS